VGYDPGTTRTEKVPIVTALLKVRSSTKEQYPILLKIHETPFNGNSPVTLLSEYQIREYGLVIDSVAKKHKTAHNQYGTQRFQVNSYVHVDFEDRGALMGFEILPVEDGDEDKYDVITITSPEQWKPRRYKDSSLSLHVTNSPDPPGVLYSTMSPEPPTENPVTMPQYEYDPMPSDDFSNFINGLTYDELVGKSPSECFSTRSTELPELSTLDDASVLTCSMHMLNPDAPLMESQLYLASA
jgi:hypothetical protein